MTNLEKFHAHISGLSNYVPVCNTEISFLEKFMDYSDTFLALMKEGGEVFSYANILYVIAFEHEVYAF